jgi:hypothetical protein
MRPEHWLNTLPLRMRSLFRRNRVGEELDEELRYHVERRAEEYEASGLPAAEARRAALVDLGGVDPWPRCGTSERDRSSASAAPPQARASTG